MKRIYAAAGAAVAALCLIIGGWFMMHRTHPQPAPAAPVYAYADLEHVVMSHPRYAEYHRLELQHNAMVAQYQFEQWNYSQKADAEGVSLQNFAVTDAAGTAALNQELQAKVALKQSELNHQLQQRYEALVQEEKKTKPEALSAEDNLKIVNLQLKLNTLSLSQAEREATKAELEALYKKNQVSEVTVKRTSAEVEQAMAPYKAQAEKELAEYTQQVKDDLNSRQAGSQQAFQQQLGVLQDRPEPEAWNKEWQDKLDGKEKEMQEVKEAIMADIRDKAASVAQDQGIDMIFVNYEAPGKAKDVTDDIIAKLA